MPDDDDTGTTACPGRQADLQDQRDQHGAHAQAAERAVHGIVGDVVLVLQERQDDVHQVGVVVALAAEIYMWGRETYRQSLRGLYEVFDRP